MTVSGTVFEALRDKFGAAIRSGRMEPPFEVVAVDRRRLAAIAKWLKVEAGFEMLTDLTAVDYLGFPGPAPRERFELVYHFVSLSRKARLRLKAGVPDADPSAPSLVQLWPSADWLEREVWDMFGIRFKGHPDLRRLLMYEEFVGHPLRKDYPVGREQPRVAQVHPGVPPFGKKPAALREEGE